MAMLVACYSNLLYSLTFSGGYRLSHHKIAAAIKHDHIVSSHSAEELQRLLAILPRKVKTKLEGHPELDYLMEILLDLGRRPVARYPSGDWEVSQETIHSSDLEEAISMVGEFADDNRAGIDRTLHRVSAIRNRGGRIVGLTCRVGRAVMGSAEIARHLVSSGDSILFMGPPGVGKTTVIREVSRMLANEYNRRVIIVDTSNEIGGDGDVPHAGIGRARRMQVPHVDMQHKIMIEAVENHMPEAIVIDEIGTELEALAAKTIAERGVQLVATAHGMTVENLIKNPSLVLLVGGIQSVTLGDEEARRRGISKSILERQGPPAFTSAVEIVSRTEWRIHCSLGATVDALLAGQQPVVEILKTDGEPDCLSTQDDPDKDEDEEIELGDAEIHSPSTTRTSSFNLYPYEVSKGLIEQVIDILDLRHLILLTDDIGIADAVLMLRSKLKDNMWVRNVAKLRRLPVFAIKANTLSQMTRAIKMIWEMEFSKASSETSHVRKEEDENQGYEMSKGQQNRKSKIEDDIDALEEARVAIEHIVIPKGQPVELLPRSMDTITLQIKLVESYQLAVQTVGTEPKARLRILPVQSTVITSSDATDIPNTCTEPSIDDPSSAIVAGTSVTRLPVLPK